jgi:hypothetical protein
MTPDAVLTEEERVIRFRKTLDKKRQRQASGQSDPERSVRDEAVTTVKPLSNYYNSFNENMEIFDPILEILQFS